MPDRLLYVLRQSVLELVQTGHPFWLDIGGRQTSNVGLRYYHWYWQIPGQADIPLEPSEFEQRGFSGYGTFITTNPWSYRMMTFVGVNKAILAYWTDMAARHCLCQKRWLLLLENTTGDCQTLRDRKV